MRDGAGHHRLGGRGGRQPGPLTLTRPYAPFLAEVLAQLPILDDTASARGARDHRARRVGDARSDAPDKLVTRVYRAVGDDACLVEQPPGWL